MKLAAHLELQEQPPVAGGGQLGVEGPMKDFVMRVMSGEVSAATILFTFFSNLLMWSLFAMIGGILTVAILNKRGMQPQKST